MSDENVPAESGDVTKPESPAGPSEKALADVGIVTALSLELGPFLDCCDRIKQYTGGKFTFRGGFLRDLRIAAVESGPGRSKATDATNALLDGHTPGWIISTGFCGAIHPDLKVGDLVVGTSVVDSLAEDLEQSSLSIDIKMKPDEQRGIHVGRLVSVPTVVRTVAERQELAERTGGIAVDMETHAVASVCRDRKVKCLAIRAVTDDANHDLPPEVLSVLGGTGSIRAGAVLGALWNRPSSYKELWQLRNNATLAAKRLAFFLESMIPRLCER